MFTFGCSKNADIPSSPDVETTNEKSSSVESHFIWGMWQFIADPDKEALDIVQLRSGDVHLNALHFLEPPQLVYLTVESVKIKGNILDADIGLKHPFSGHTEFTGFDVCGIFITNGSITGFHDPDLRVAGEGDTRLLNTDGYTRWWNPLEFPHGTTILNYIDGMLGTPANSADYNCALNAYKYFADGLDKDTPVTTLDPASRGVFSVGAKNIRHYKIDLSGGLIFNYAVDACWKMPQGKPPYTVPDDFPEGANRPEAWNASVTELENTLYYSDNGGSGGGELNLLIDVYDHFNAALNKVSAESLSGLPYASSLSPIGGGEGYSTYQLDFTGENLTNNGDAELLITVESETIGYGGILPGKPISAYFVWHFNILHHPNGTAWARTWGGVDDDIGFGVAIDGSGNAYVTGQFMDTVDFDPGPGVDEHTSNGHNDIFLSKFDSNGEFLWARTWGGSFNDLGWGVAIDGSGNAYITGDFMGTVDFDPGPGADEHSYNGVYDIFLSKFDSNGEFQWARTWGGDYDDYGNGVAIDGSGNSYITGLFWGTVDFDPGPGVDEHKSYGDSDIFLSKFDSNGEFQWARTWGGYDRATAYGVAIDGSGNAYITGYFEGTADFDPGPGVDEHPSNGVYDIFLTKFNSNGEFQWARTWGAYNWDMGYGVAIDGSDNPYVTGYFMETVDFDTGPGVKEYASNGLADIFLSKFDSNGDFQWAHGWGGIYDDFGYGVAVDGSGNAFVTGGFLDTVDFNPGPGADWHTSNGHHDIFLSKFPPDGYW